MKNQKMIMYLTSLRVFMTIISISLNTMYHTNNNSNHICSWGGRDVDRFFSFLNSSALAFIFALSSAVHSFFVHLGLINSYFQCKFCVSCKMVYVKKSNSPFCWMYLLGFVHSLSGKIKSCTASMIWYQISNITLSTLYRNLL